MKKIWLILLLAIFAIMPFATITQGHSFVSQSFAEVSAEGETVGDVDDGQAPTTLAEGESFGYLAQGWKKTLADNITGFDEDESDSIFVNSAVVKITINSDSSTLEELSLGVDYFDVSDTSKTGSSVFAFYDEATQELMLICENEIKTPVISTKLFEGFKTATEINGLELLDTSDTNDFVQFFNNCNSVVSLNVSSFNTSQATNMSQMFNGCSALTTLNLSQFNTSQVINMSSMFNGCSRLANIQGLTSFDTAKVTSMASMFHNCSAIKTLDLSSFNTENVTTMICMFYNCSSLENLNIGNFNTEKVTNMAQMFYVCKALTSLDLSHFNTSKVLDMYAMFHSCSALKTLNVSSFDTSSVNTNTSKDRGMGFLFYGCRSLEELDISSFDMSNVGEYYRVEGERSHQDGLFKFGNANESIAIKKIVLPYNIGINQSIEDYEILFPSNIKLFKLEDSGAYTQYTSLNKDNASTETDKITLYRGYDISYIQTSPLNPSGRKFVESYIYSKDSESSVELLGFADDYVYEYGVPTGFQTGSGIINGSVLQLAPGTSGNIVIAASARKYTITYNSSTKASTSQILTEEVYLNKYGITINVLDKVGLAEEGYTYRFSQLKSQVAGASIEGNILEITADLRSNLVVIVDKYENKGYFQTNYTVWNNALSLKDVAQKNAITKIYFTNNENSVDFPTSATWIETGINVTKSNYVYSIKACVDNGILWFYCEKPIVLENCSNLFREFQKVTEINFKYGQGDTLAVGVSNDTISASSMFYNCYALSTINGFSELEFNNLENIGSMFYRCKALQEIDLSNMNFAKIRDFAFLFYENLLLEEIIYPADFTTEKATNLYAMYYGCELLDNNDFAILSKFDTSNVTNMGYMFCNNKAVTTLDISNFDTAKVTIMKNMFSGCVSLKEIIFCENFGESAEQMQYMFNLCIALESLDLSKFNTSKVVSMYYMFSGCSSLKSLDLSSFDISSVTEDTFSSTTKVEGEGTFSNKLSGLGSMFAGCSRLEELNLSSFDMTNVRFVDEKYDGSAMATNSFKSMIAGCVKLNKLYLPYNMPDDAEITIPRTLYANNGGVYSSQANITSENDAISLAEEKVLVSKTTITFDADNAVGEEDGTTTLDVYFDQSEISIVIPEKTGYNFVGYYDQTLTTQYISGSGELINPWAIKDSSITLKAKWVAATYVIDFDYSEDLDVIYGEPISDISIPERNGLTFDGYYLGETEYFDETGKFVYSEMWNIPNGVQLTAKWTNNTYKITYSISNKKTTRTVELDYTFDETNEYNINISNHVNPEIGYNFENIEITSVTGATYANGVLTIPANTYGDISVSVQEWFKGGYLHSKWKTNIAIDKETTEVYFTNSISAIESNISDYTHITEGVNASKDIYTYSIDVYKNGTVYYIYCPEQIYISSAGSLFYEYKQLTTVDLSNINTSDCTDFSYMFYECYLLTGVDLTKLNTDKATTMYAMFHGCKSISEFNFSTFNTSNVKNMGYMFLGCTNATTLDLSGFDLSSLTSNKLDKMFEMNMSIAKLKQLILPYNMPEGISIPTDKLNLWYEDNSGTMVKLTEINSDNDSESADNSVYAYKQYAIKFTITTNPETNEKTVVNKVYYYSDSETTINLVENTFVFEYVYNVNITTNSQAGSSIGADNFRISIPAEAYGNIVATATVESSNITIAIKDSNGESTITKVYYQKTGEQTFDINLINDVVYAVSWTTNGAGATISVENKELIIPEQATGDIKVTLNANKYSITYKVYKSATAVEETTSENYYQMTIDQDEIDIISKLDSLTSDYSYENIRLEDEYSNVDISEGKLQIKANANTNIVVCIDKYENKGYLLSDWRTKLALNTNEADRNSITKIEFTTTYNASFDSYDSYSVSTTRTTYAYPVTAYRNGAEIYIYCEKVMYCTSFASFVYSFQGLTTLNLSQLNTSLSTSFSSMLYNCKNLTQLILPDSGFDVSNATSLYAMFYGCSLLDSFDLEFIATFNTSKVTNMGYMFFGCKGVTTLNFSNFDTSKVTNMNKMFQGCESLTSLDLSSFNTSNVGTFEQGSGANKKYYSGLGDMFSGCKALKSLDISSFNMQNVRFVDEDSTNAPLATNSLYNMLFSTTNLEEITLPYNVPEGAQINLGKVFYYKGNGFVTKYENLLTAENDAEAGTNKTVYTSISFVLTLDHDNSEADTVQNIIYDSSVGNVEIPEKVGYGFKGYYLGDEVYFNELGEFVKGENGSIWTIPNDVSLIARWENANYIITYNYGSAIPQGEFIVEYKYQSNATLNILIPDVAQNGLDFCGWVITEANSNVTDKFVLEEITGGTNLRITQGGYGNLEITAKLYAREGILSKNWKESIPSNILEKITKISFINVSDVESMQLSRAYSFIVGTADLNNTEWHETAGNYPVLAVINGTELYVYCEKTLYAPVDATNLFSGFDSLTSIEFNNILNTSRTKKMEGMFKDNEALVSLDLSSIDTSKVTDMKAMFMNLTNVETTNFNGFNTSNVVEMSYMFKNASPAILANTTLLDTSKVLSMAYMFSVDGDNSSQNVTVLDLSSFDTSSVENMTSMFANRANLETIYVNSSLWSTENVNRDTNMFKGCIALKGNSGSTWNDEYAGNDNMAPGADSAILGGLLSQKPGTQKPIDTSLIYIIVAVGVCVVAVAVITIIVVKKGKKVKVNE